MLGFDSNFSKILKFVHKCPVNSLAPVPVHCGDVIISAIASHITSLAIVYSAFYSGADQRKHQNSASLAFVRGIHRWQVNSPHKGLVTRKMFPFDDVIMHFWCQTTKCSKPCFLIEPLQQEGICEHGWMWIETAVVINRFDEMKASHYRDVIMSVISNHRRLDCLLNRLFKHRSKKTLKLRVTGLCEGNSPVTDEFPAQRPSNAEN